MPITATLTSDGEYHIFLEQTFDFNSISDFRNTYENIDTDSLQSGVVLDFRKTNYIDSSALGMLINMQKYLQGKCSSYRIVNVNEQLKKIFLISHFDKKFTLG